MIAFMQSLMNPSQGATIVAFLMTILVSLMLTPYVVQLAATRGFFDNPRGGERPARRQISRLGGIVVFVASTSGMFVALALGAIPREHDRFLLSLLCGGGTTFALGLYDDIYGARARTKLLVQAIAALIVYAFGTRIGLVTLGDVPGIDVGALSLPLTVLWIVGVTNAFNLIDGLDGLATGIGLVVLSAVTLAALLLGNREVVLVSLLLVAALLGFLRYNVSPAKIFLGDSGSLFIGFMLSVLSIHGSLKSTTAVLVAIPIFALAVPLLDSGVAILRRFLRGSPVFGPDARHIHHRLVAIGLTPHRAASVLWGTAAAFAIFGLSITFAPPPLLLGLAIAGGMLAMALVFFGVRQLEYIEFVEAAMTIARRGGGFRKEIRDQIHARETVAIVHGMKSLDELNAMLSERAPRFGFTQMEVNRVESLRAAPSGADVPPLLKVDYPVTRAGDIDHDRLVLRIWCALDMRHPAHGAIRVARILAPSIERWICESDGVIPPPAARIERRRRSDDVGRPITVETGEVSDAAWPAH